MGNGRVFDFQDPDRVLYKHVGSGMRISGGQNARIEKRLVIFQNLYGNNPISGVADSINRIMYCSSQEG